MSVLLSFIDKPTLHFVFKVAQVKCIVPLADFSNVSLECTLVTRVIISLFTLLIHSSCDVCCNCSFLSSIVTQGRHNGLHTGPSLERM